MNSYKLLTPGPLTTTDSVKREMLTDRCTWDDDYKAVTQRIRSSLLELGHVNPENYTCVLMQGSGTYGVESVLSSVVGETDKVLICSNGAYGLRMAQICDWSRIPYAHYEESFDRIPDTARIEEFLSADPAITHIAMVHSETTSGLLNDIESVGKLAKRFGKTLIVDAMSSFGGIEIPVEDWNIDFLVSSANKCIQGVPGFSFILCRRDLLRESRTKGRSLSLNLYEQWAAMEKDGKWRFTSPTHTVLAFAKAIEELELEGGIPARAKRYAENNRLLIELMGEMGFQPYLTAHQSPIITTFRYPADSHFSFESMYLYIKERGYAIYPGKLTDEETFRIGNIGEIYPEDIRQVTDILRKFLTLWKENHLDKGCAS